MTTPTLDMRRPAPSTCFPDVPAPTYNRRATLVFESGFGDFTATASYAYVGPQETHRRAEPLVVHPAFRTGS